MSELRSQVAANFAKTAKDKKDKNEKPSTLGRIGRGLGTVGTTALGAEVGGAAGAGAGYGLGRLASKASKGKLPKAKGKAGLVGAIAGGLLGAGVGGKKVYDKTKYKKGESEKKYRAMTGYGYGGPAGAIYGAATSRKGHTVGGK